METTAAAELQSGEDCALSEQMLSALAVECSPVALVVTDLATRILHVNPAFRQLWDVGPRQKVAGRLLAQICGERVRFLGELARGGETCSGDLKMRDPHGSDHRVRYHAARINGARNAPVGFVINFSSLHRRSSAGEAGAPIAGDSSQDAVRASGMGAWVIELAPDGTSLEGTPRWTDGVFSLLGYSPGKIATATVNYLHAVHADDRERVRAELEESVAQGAALRSVHRLRQANGDLRHVCLETHVSRDGATGKPKYLLCSLQDVTQYARLRRRLHDKEVLLRNLLEGCDWPIFTVDRELRYTSFNSAYVFMKKKVWEATPELGESVLDGIYSLSDRRRLRENLRRALDGLRAVESTTFGMPFYSGDMEYLPVTDASAAVVGAAVFIRNTRALGGASGHPHS